MNPRAFLLLPSLLSLLAVACAAPAGPDDEQSDTASAIRGGEVVAEKSSSVGHLFLEGTDDQGESKINYCTGTLVTPNAVLTSARCAMGLATLDKTHGEFVVGGRLTSFAVDDRGVSHAFVGEPRGGFQVPSDLNKALVLLKLSRPVPVGASVDIAESAPAKGTTVSIYGYGCSETPDDFGVLRTAKVKWGATFGSSVGCRGQQGDFGAPLFDDAGKLVAVLGSVDAGVWALATGTDDLVTLTPDLAREVRARIAEWSR